MSKLDDIFNEARDEMIARFNGNDNDPFRVRTPTKEQVKALMLELIGADVEVVNYTKFKDQHINRLKAELRRKVKEL